MAEAMRRRQEVADLQRQKMEEERKKQIEFLKAGKDALGAYTFVFLLFFISSSLFNSLALCNFLMCRNIKLR